MLVELIEQKLGCKIFDNIQKYNNSNEKKIEYISLKLMIEKNNFSLKNKKVLILGSGEKSKITFDVVKDLGAKDIFRVSKTKKENYMTYEEVKNKSSDVDIIINASSIGSYPNNDECPIDIENFPNLSGLIDLVYNPLRTRLVLKALEKNIVACGGLYMLVAQAIYAMDFVNNEENIKNIDEIYKKILRYVENIVLIGMPSSGKSTVGKILAKKVDKNFLDSDIEILKYLKTTIKEFFVNHGEKEFREIEHILTKDISKLNRTVISTGGGVILNKENIIFLKQNGIVIFIDRSLDNLFLEKGRPLLSSREKLAQIYEERYDRYISYSDIYINGDRDPYEVEKDIIDKLI